MKLKAILPSKTHPIGDASIIFRCNIIPISASNSAVSDTRSPDRLWSFSDKLRLKYFNRQSSANSIRNYDFCTHRPIFNPPQNVDWHATSCQQCRCMQSASEIFETAVTNRLSNPLLCRFLAFEIKAREFGGLPKGVSTKLAGLTQRGPKRRTQAPRAADPGMDETTYAVVVVEGGFLNPPSARPGFKKRSLLAGGHRNCRWK